MKLDFLVGLGMDNDKAETILSEHEKTVLSFKNEAESYKAQLDTNKKTLKEANAEIERYKSMDIESIKASAEEWKSKAERADSEAKAQIDAFRFDAAVNSALQGAKARNVKAVKALLDMDGIKLNDNGIVGLNEQLENIKKENSFLFGNNGADGGPGFGNQNAPTANTDINSAMNSFIRGAASKGE